MGRIILHIDLDAFFCSVEEKLNPSLMGTPFAVGGTPSGRGVVTSCSYAARKMGVRSAMPSYIAQKKCPNIQFVTPNIKSYSTASNQIINYLKSITLMIEQVSIDEAFLDATDLGISGELLARKIQREINETHKLPCSIGVATNKLVAKIANDYGKTMHDGDFAPNTITVVAGGEEEKFLAPLPVKMLWGVGQKTAELLADLNIRTIGDLAQAPDHLVIQTFGKHGKSFIKRARGISDSKIQTSRIIKSISNETTFPYNSRNLNYVQENLLFLSQRVGKRLRKINKQAKTVKLKIRWADFSTITRQLSFDNAFSSDEKIYATAEYLLRKEWTPSKSVRLIGICVASLVDSTNQLTLWDNVVENMDSPG